MTSHDLELRPPNRAVGRWTTQALLCVLPPVLFFVLLTLFIPPAWQWLLMGAAVVGVPGLVITLVLPS